MKLLQINSVVNTGSTGRIAEGIGNKAIENGWESYIAYGRYGNKSNSNVVKIGNKWSNYIHVGMTRLFDAHGLSSSFATKKFVKQIQQIKPDIIHLHNIHGYYINYKILFDFLKSYHAPVVWTLHDSWAYTGHCAYYDFINCQKWQSQCDHCPCSFNYPKSYINRSHINFKLKKKYFTSVKNLILIPVSNWLKIELKKSYLSDNKTFHIYNGIDTSVFKPEDVDDSFRIKYNIPLEKKIYLGVANIWEQRKGLDDFIKINEILLSDEQIVLVGLSEKQINALPSNIIGIERTENIGELVMLYSLADVLINPTWEDNFPTINLEALACGTPVITYDTGGSPEAVDNNTGRVVPKGDLKSLRLAIDELRNSDRSILSRNCRERAIKHFEKDDRFQEYIDLYQSLLMK
ncbi:MAG: glycosyltransferase [Saprospiraceae bacterium]|nr:glycosyltransferase [Saprospiraceae bacterium]WKZ64415.1 MAG: glycosyltransferase [Saprospiraceae bacterium]